MVATLFKLTDATAGKSYYTNDDYFSREGGGHWHGRGAPALGLDGEVDPDQFVARLAGELPDGTLLGTTRHGVREHVPGFDLTMSAPKSISTLALVAGDRRLIDAHNQAVQVALGYTERHVAVTRIRSGETVDRIATSKLAIAQFLHVTARATENGTPAPQLHTHNVILNMTRDDGTWRSLDARDLYALQKSIGAVYHQELAFEVQRLGYSVTIAHDTTFEIDGVPDDVLRTFSARSAQIEAVLDARGKTRATASAAEKAVITLDTRAPKRAVDHATLAADWRAQAEALGFDERARRGMVAQAEARAARQTTLGTDARMREADHAVAFAAQHIAEREAVFSAATLERQSGDAVRARATHADIVAAIDRAERAQRLVIRAAPRMATGMVGFATREAVEIERRMLRLEAEGRDQVTPLHGRIQAASVVAAAELRSAERGHTWTKGQKTATQGLLMSRAKVAGVQGSAGTAKTTTVIATYADAARAQGFEVRALAPTATAATVLADAISAKPMTVAMLLASTGDTIKQDREVWIVDEASLLDARDTEQTIARARDAGARLVLVGDVKQLGSVGAGRAFAQLQDHKMETFVLDQIVRQTNEQTREAVEAMIAGDAKTAFAALDAGGGAIVEQPDTDARLARIAQDFAKLSPEDRAGTLVLDPTREGRQRLTNAIRAELVADGTLGAEAITATVLESRGLSRTEAKRATSYTPGDIVTFREAAKGKPRPGVGYRIDSVDAQNGTVRLVPPNPKAKSHDWQPARWGGDHAEAFAQVQQEFRTGDKVQFTRNNYRANRLNGATAMVVAIEPAGIERHGREGRRRAPDARLGAPRRPAYPPRLGPHDPQQPGRDVRSGDGPPGEFPRQHRRYPCRLCRHQPRPRRGHDLHRQPRQAHRSAWIA